MLSHESLTLMLRSQKSLHRLMQINFQCEKILWRPEIIYTYLHTHVNIHIYMKSGMVWEYVIE